MKRASATYPLAALLFFAGGCAPSFEGLVRDRHYDEAMAAIRHRDAGPEVARERAELVRALEADLDPALHAVALSQQTLQEQLGPAADSLKDALVVRLHMTANAVPVESVAFDVRLRSGERPADAVPVDLVSLARRTGEALPEAVVEQVTATGDPVQRAGHALAEAGWWSLLIVTGGLSGLLLDQPRPLPSPETRTTVTEPTRADITARAPRAVTLFEALQAARPSGEPADAQRRSGVGVLLDAADVPLHEHAFVVWKRDSALAEGPLALDFAVTVFGEVGYVKLLRTIELPKGPSVEARFAARFGRAELPLRALGPARAVWSGDEPLEKVMSGDKW